MNNKMGRIRKEEVLAQLKILFRHLPGVTKKHEKHHSGQTVSGSDFNPGPAEH
jgi:hypothetical protein